MKIIPQGSVFGIEFPEKITKYRSQIAHAIKKDNVVFLGEYFDEWRSWIIRIENDVSLNVCLDSSVIPVFTWNFGSSPCVRFESACLSYAYGRALFHVRQYARAYACFGLALEETMQCRSILPLTPKACGMFRLRCLVRAQRLGICELNSESRVNDLAWLGNEIYSRAIWLEMGLRIYALFSGSEKKEPLTSGKSLVMTARAMLTNNSIFAKQALGWTQNPFYNEMITISQQKKSLSFNLEKNEHITQHGEFDWTRFMSDRTYST